MDEIPVVWSRRDADEGGITNHARVNELKREIEKNQYDVPAPAVADAILRKIRLLKQGRASASSNGAGHIQPEPGDLPAR